MTEGIIQPTKPPLIFPSPDTETGQFRALRAVALLGIALTCVCVSIVATLFGVTIVAVLAAIAGAFPICGELAVSITQAREPESDDIVVRVAREVSSGRKLAIYDQDTGLYAKWYLLLRGEEECSRAKRYGRPLALVFIAIADSPQTERFQADADVSRWLQARLRTTDIVGYLGQGRYAFIATETDSDGATRLVERLRSGVDNISIAVSRFPEDGGTFEELWADADEKLTVPRLAA